MCNQKELLRKWLLRSKENIFISTLELRGRIYIELMDQAVDDLLEFNSCFPGGTFTLKGGPTDWYGRHRLTYHDGVAFTLAKEGLNALVGLASPKANWKRQDLQALIKDYGTTNPK